ncbi:AraC family transcriptional regulator [Bradyrhizobium sp. CCBAU 53421]|nr:AraC family transcriptional regulator [Bradyrhizobium sp. CCBAU 53421]
MSKPLIEPSRADTDAGSPLIAVLANGGEPRVTPAHRHARGQLLGATHGLVTVGMDSGHWVVPAIHCVWIPPHHSHALCSHGPFVGWSVYVAEDCCVDLPAVPRTMQMSSLLRECVARAATWSDSDQGLARTHLTEVIRDEIRSLPREQFGLPMPTDPRLLRVARALADDPADKRRLDDWAILAGSPVRTLTRRFPIETGFSFTEWRQRVRLMRALEMLADEIPVTTIALDLGYETVSAFIALFRRTFGTTPARYFPRAPARQR